LLLLRIVSLNLFSQMSNAGVADLLLVGQVMKKI